MVDTDNMLSELSVVSIKGQGHFLTLAKGHLQIKCKTYNNYVKPKVLVRFNRAEEGYMKAELKLSTAYDWFIATPIHIK